VISLPSGECHVSHNPEKAHQEKGSENLAFFFVSSVQCSILTSILKKILQKQFRKKKAASCVWHHHNDIAKEERAKVAHNNVSSPKQ
jgi:hypothetical protein